MVIYWQTPAVVSALDCMTHAYAEGDVLFKAEFDEK